MYSTNIINALPFRVASTPAVRSDLNGGFPTCLWCDSLHIRIIWLLVYLWNLCKPDMVLISIYVEYILSESEFELTPKQQDFLAKNIKFHRIFAKKKPSHTADICWSKSAYTPPTLTSLTGFFKKWKPTPYCIFSPDIKDCISSHPTVWNYYMQGSTTVHHFLVWFEPAILRCGPIAVQDYQLYLNPQESHLQVCGTSTKMSHQMTLYNE